MRRFLVFGVASIGVLALYVVPTLTHPHSSGALPPPSDDPTSQTPSVSDGRQLAPPAAFGASAPAAQGGQGPDPTTSPTATGVRAPSTGSRVPARGGTAYDPADTGDHAVPDAVGRISVAGRTSQHLKITWPDAHDDVGVVGYRVWLSGFAVKTTHKTSATLVWFNDDTADQTVQIRALDAAGNLGPSSPTLLVTRPDDNEPEPSPSPTPSPEASEPAPADPSPTPAPSAESTTEAHDDGDANANALADGDPTPNEQG